ncbi:DUF5630 domain-containing protein [Legionella sp. CNM-1927-20]|uniref:DUF5630 domain-containing protein n=1 Tax=Legionella sp. CNM-1927-20 TaxID=3422221 RepID=UPI00403A90FB
MSLENFLSLSAEDNYIFSQILLHLPSTEEEVDEPNIKNLEITDKLYSIIINAPESSLFKIALIYPLINQICQQSMFDDYWESLWRQCGSGLQEEAKNNQDTRHENVPMPTLSCLDLLKGLFVYQVYCDLIKDKEMTPTLFDEAAEYLKLAGQIGCFFALNELCIEGLKLLSKYTDQSIAAQILFYAQRAAELYWTPGYLLLSNVYQELSSYPLLSINGDEVLQKQFFFKEALNALTMAQQLEQYSFPMISNAYQGKSIWQATQGQLKNWFHAKIRLQKMSGNLLTNLDFERTSLEAKKEVEQIKAKWNLMEQSNPLTSPRCK